MQFSRVSFALRSLAVASTVILALASLLYTQRLVEQLQARERGIVALWAQALEDLPRSAAAQSSDASVNVTTEAILLAGKFRIPAIIIDLGSGQIVSFRNIDGIPDTVSLYTGTAESDAIASAILADTAGMSTIELDFAIGNLRQRLYYGESDLIAELRYYPYFQLFALALLLFMGYKGLSYVRKTEQAGLWVGMAKEAAHQLGTPVSSLLGWLEMLRSQASKDETTGIALEEMGRDVDRLQRVANRFSDIGSTPRLSEVDVANVAQKVIDYIARRVPNHGGGPSITLQGHATAQLNAELFDWVMENLIKNALDALEPSRPGVIEVSISTADRFVYVDVSDNGRGMERAQFEDVFRPGYSTKKRGWGLGLSLSRRIIRDYHKGMITVLRSKVGEGTTIRVSLPR